MIYRDMINFSHTKRSKVCLTNRVIHWKELDETWRVGGVTIVGVTFMWFERNLEKDHRDMTQNPTGAKIMRQNL